MSFDIGAVDQVQGTQAPTSPAASAPQAQEALTVEAGHDEAVAVDTFPASPPPELSDAIAAAAQAYDDLEASGRRLHFAVDPPTGRLSIEVHDLSGNVLSTLTPGEVLDVAGGGQLPG